jgi:ADP-heptose:LPS heptosyltransferase
MKVLAIKVSPVGDTVMFLPVIQELRRVHPTWKIAVLTTPTCAGLFESSVEPGLLWTEDRTSLHRMWRSPLRALGWVLRVLRFDPDAVLVSFDQPSMARILAAASGARTRIGGAESAVSWRHGLTNEVAIRPGHSLAQWDWEMARSLPGLAGDKWAEVPPRPSIGSQGKGEKRRTARIIVHPGASRAYQMWPAERFASLALGLARDFEVLWVLSPGQTVRSPGGPVAEVETRSLESFIELASSSDLFVGNHSGPFHLSAAIGTPCVIPTGPTLGVCDPPWSREGTHLMRMKGLPCMPCDKLIVSPNRCTNTDTPMACLNHWEPAAVEAACREMLAKGRATGLDAPRPEADGEPGSAQAK